MLRYLSWIFGFLICSNTLAQTHELGLGIGNSFYFGELNDGNLYRLTRPAFAGFYRYGINTRWALKTALSTTTLQGADSLSSNAANRDRNLSFKTPIIELSSQIEFNFLPFALARFDLPFTSYMCFGFAMFYYNPQAAIGSRMYELRKLGTEGQGMMPNAEKAYNQFAGAFIMGTGIKWKLSKRLAMGLEFAMRRTFTDFIDDVSGKYPDPKYYRNPERNPALLISSKNKEDAADMFTLANRQRGNPRTKDWYNFTMLTINFQIGGFDKCQGMERKNIY